MHALKILQFEFTHSNSNIMHTELSPDRQYNSTGFTEVQNYWGPKGFYKKETEALSRQQTVIDISGVWGTYSEKCQAGSKLCANHTH